MLSKKLLRRKQLISIGEFSLQLKSTMTDYFRDPSDVKRAANHISWYADGARKMAVSYCNLDFQSGSNDSFIDSYIWDIGNH